jgi:hypothetical protein
MRHTVVTNGEAIELRRNLIVKRGPRAGLRQPAAKRIALLKHDRFATARLSVILSQRINKGKTTVGRVVVDALFAAADVKTSDERVA